MVIAMAGLGIGALCNTVNQADRHAKLTRFFCSTFRTNRRVHLLVSVSKETPWAVSWQHNERQTEWCESDKGRLVGLLAEGKFGSRQEFNEQVSIACAIIPNLKESFATMHPATLEVILNQPEHCANRMIQLRVAFDYFNLDVGRLVCAYPKVLLWPDEQLHAVLRSLEGLFGSMEMVSVVLESQPWVLDAGKGNQPFLA